jgi:type I restriction enzyme, S subunit
MGAKTMLAIEDIAEKIIDYRGKTPPKSDKGVRLVTAKVIKNGFIQEERSEYISEDTYSSWMRRGYPQQHDIVITTEAPLGEVAQLRTTEKVALAQRVILLRAKQNVMDQQYFYQALKSPIVQANLQQRSTGTTVLGIKQSELRKVEVPYFPLPTQHKIAAILSAYDDLIENNLRRIKILEEMAQNLYREWFVNFRFPGHEKARFVDSPLGLIPDGWKVVKATDAIYINPRTSVLKDSIKPYVAMNGLSTDSMLISNVEERSGNSGSKYKNNDTLFARITPCLEHGKTGFVSFLPNDEAVGLGSTEFIVLRSKTLCPEYIYFLARSEDFRGNAIKSMSGASGRQRVQYSCFDNYFLAHPDDETLQIFAGIIRPYFQLINLIADKNIYLRQTRELLLPKLISGEVDISELDINDPEEVSV